MKTRARHGRFWVYLVQCADGTFYAGATNDLEKRVEVHNAGNGAKYVRGRGPVKIVYTQAYRFYQQALQAERALKKLTRKRKEEVIAVYNQANSGRLTR